MTAPTRRTPRLRPIHFVLSLVLAFAGIVAIAGPAQADVDVIKGDLLSGPTDLTTVDVYLSKELSGATGQIFDTGSGALLTHPDGSGHFEFGPVVPPGDYYLLVDDPAHQWVQHLEYIVVDGATDLASLVITLDAGIRITGTVRDAEAPYPFISTAGVVALAAFPDVYSDWLTLDISSPYTGSALAPWWFGLGGSPYIGDLSPVSTSGAYSIVVPLLDEYEVAALDVTDHYGPQSWDHRYSCGCTVDLVEVPDASGWPYLTPITGIDFDLYLYDHWIYFSVYTDNLNGDPLEDVLLHLDWRATSSDPWTLDVDTATTDEDGLADLWGLGDGDYQLRYQIGGVYRAIDSWYESSYATWPVTDGKSVLLDGLMVSCGCGDYTSLYPDLTFPVTFPSSGGTPSAPGIPRRPAASNVSAFVTATPTPTPSATPTSSPSPSSSPSSSPSPSETPAPAPAVDTGFPWWIILVIVLVLGIIVTIIVIVRRR